MSQACAALPGFEGKQVGALELELQANHLPLEIGDTGSIPGYGVAHGVIAEGIRALVVESRYQPAPGIGHSDAHAAG